MKIKEIKAVKLNVPPRTGKPTSPRRPSWAAHSEVANPMSKYPQYKRHRSSWLPKWGSVFVKVTAEDGTWGLGQTTFGRPVAAIIDDHFAPKLVSENCFAVEKIWDMMFRMSKPYGSLGLTSCAMSGIDLALWDLIGKIKNQPVYELLGGPVRDKLFAYATGNDTDWQIELGFKGVKLACPYGPVDGLWGLKENEKLVAKTRELVGDDVEIMLDCYMAFDVDYTIRLAQRLKPYRLKWIEEFSNPGRYRWTRQGSGRRELGFSRRRGAPLYPLALQTDYRERVSGYHSTRYFLGWGHHGMRQDLSHGRCCRTHRHLSRRRRQPIRTPSLGGDAEYALGWNTFSDPHRGCPWKNQNRSWENPFPKTVTLRRIMGPVSD